MVNSIRIDDARFEGLNTTTVTSKGKVLVVPSKNNILEDLVSAIGGKDIAELAIRMIVTDVRNKSNAKPSKLAENKDAFEAVTAEDLAACAGDHKKFTALLQQIQNAKVARQQESKEDTEAEDIESKV